VAGIVALAACGAAGPEPHRAGTAIHPRRCLRLSPASPLPSLQNPVPVPIAGGSPVRLTIDGEAAGDEVLDNALEVAAQDQMIDQRLYQSPRPSPGELTLQRGAVSAVVLRHMETCQAVQDGIKPDRAKAESTVAHMLRAIVSPAPYNTAPTRADSMPPAVLGAPSPTAGTPHPYPSPAVARVFGTPPGSAGWTGYTPASAPPIPGGLTAEQYYGSAAYVEFIEESQVRLAEEKRILGAAPGQPRWQVLGEWMRQHLGAYDVRTAGLGSFSLPDAYEALGAYTAP